MKRFVPGTGLFFFSGKFQAGGRKCTRNNRRKQRESTELCLLSVNKVGCFRVTRFGNYSGSH